MKNKVIISNYDSINNPYYGGGGAIAVHEIAQRLVKFFDVEVVSGKYPDSKDYIVNGVRYHFVGVASGKPQLDQLAYQVWLPLLAIFRKYDLWFESFTPPFSTTFLPLFTRKPVIGVIHMLSGEDMKRKYHLPFDLVEKFGLRFYKRVVVTSHAIELKVKKINKEIIVSVIPNGVNFNSRSISDNSKKHILFLGRIEVNQKGLDLLLQAYAVATRKLHAPILIAGSGEKKEEEKLGRLIASLGLGDKVKRVGWVDGKIRERAYRESLCMVVPSRFETFSLSALEAMAYKLPLITFDIDGLSWIPATCRIVAKKFDINDLAKSLCLTTDPKVSKLVTKNAIEFVTKFSWENAAHEYNVLIKEVI